MTFILRQRRVSSLCVFGPGKACKNIGSAVCGAAVPWCDVRFFFFTVLGVASGLVRLSLPLSDERHEVSEALISNVHSDRAMSERLHLVIAAR